MQDINVLMDDSIVVEVERVGVIPGSSLAHNGLSGIQGGSASERYHLSVAQLALLGFIDQDLRTTASPRFAGLGVGTVATVPFEITTATAIVPATSTTYTQRVLQGGGSLAFGGDASYGYIQTFGKALQLNNQGNNTILNAAGGNIGIGTTSFGTSGNKVVAIASHTAPTTSPADVVQLYSADQGGVAGQAGLHIRTEDGSITSIGRQIMVPSGSVTNPVYGFSGEANSGFYRAGTNDLRISVNGADFLRIINGAVYLNGASPLHWGGTGITGADVSLCRDAANTLALRNGTNAQAFNLYNTYTDASNYERVQLRASGGIFSLRAQNIGTGQARELHLVTEGAAALKFATNGTQRWIVEGSSGAFFPGADATYDLGSNSYRVKDGWFSGKVAVGSGSLTEALNIYSDNPFIQISDSDPTTRLAGIALVTNGGTWNIQSGYSGGTDSDLFITRAKDTSDIYLRITHTTGNFIFGGSGVAGTSATRTLVLPSGTAPSSSPADAVQLWSADTAGVAGKAGLHIRTEDGTSHVFGDMVGIGTISPSSLLHVEKDTGSSDLLYLRNLSTADGRATIKFANEKVGNTGNYWRLGISPSGGVGTFGIRYNALSEFFALDTSGNAYITGSTTLGNDKRFCGKDTAGTGIPLLYVGGDNTISIGAVTAPTNNGHLLMYANGAEAARFNPSGTLLIGTVNAGTSITKGVVLGSGVAPTTSPADAIQIWSADRNGTAGKASLHLRTEDGTSHVFGDRVGIGRLDPYTLCDIKGQLSIGDGDRTGVGSTWPLYISATNNLGWKVADGSGNTKFELYCGYGTNINEMRLFSGVSLHAYSQNLMFGIGGTIYGEFNTDGGRFIYKAPNTAPTDSNIGNGKITAWLDETNGQLKFRIRKSDGTYATASVPYS